MEKRIKHMQACGEVDTEAVQYCKEHNMKVACDNDTAFALLVRTAVFKYGNLCDLNWIDTSNVKSLDFVFYHCNHFNGDISKWDVSNVTSMKSTFNNSEFDGDISKWNVSNVKNMHGAFAESSFRGDISNWDVSNVEDMELMFYNSKFNGDISRWDVSNVHTMLGMFAYARFANNIANWNVSNVDSFTRMFYRNQWFNQDLSKWEIRPGALHNEMFDLCPIKDNYLPVFN